MRQILAKLSLSAAILAGVAIAADAAPQGAAIHPAGAQIIEGGSGLTPIVYRSGERLTRHRYRGAYSGEGSVRPDPVPPAPETPN